MGELFSGAGGLALGAKMAGISFNENELTLEHRWANDFDISACETFKNNICPDKPETVICKDVRQLDVTKLEKINAFAFSFPTPDYSVSGVQNENEIPLYKYGINVLNHHQTHWFIAETVCGFGRSSVFNEIIKTMEYSRYNVTPHLYKFAEYGIPQIKHRIIIVGIRKEFGWAFKISKVPFKDMIFWKTAKEALESPKIPNNAYNHVFYPLPQKVVEMLKAIMPGDNAGAAYIPEHLQLRVTGNKLSQSIYKRLDPNAPSYNVIGLGGIGTHMYHYSEPRALTNRETARLQTFPDNFGFYGGKESVRKQIAAAIPPEGARLIIEAILKSFAGIPYETEPSSFSEEILIN